MRFLVAGLGHDPIHDIVPGVGLAVGHIGRFPWFAVQGVQPERLARRMARRLLAHGRVAGVLALDPWRRLLGVAVAYGGTPTLGLELDRPTEAALAALVRLAGRVDAPSPLAYAARAADALSSEPIGRRFFREFRTTLERMTGGLAPTLRAEDRRSLALLHLTRVLFLYFIQAKGWLAGQDRFLANGIDACLMRRRRIHRDFLRPLFFGTLNRPRADRGRFARAFGAIPFLNGGLFEPHPLERATRADIPNTLWRDAFDHLFERFHFVVAEDGPAGSIAPDMLGQVFEGVMAPDARRTSGTYYTPAALVRSMLDSAFTSLVAGRLGCSEGEAERRLDNRDSSAGVVLERITLLDPAAGSGAFLLGALERLAVHAHGGGISARRRVLQRNLFGVDRNAMAVRLTELRLWLAVIADDCTDRPDQVQPLPNLDCLIRQGDSLLEPAGVAARLAPQDAMLAGTVAAVRRRLVTASGAEKAALVRELRAAECRVAEAALRAGELSLQRGIRERVQNARAPDLFGTRRGAERRVHLAIAGARTELRAVRAARRSLMRNREVPWFHYPSHFADVFAAGGFDLVVGNPPWLRAELIPSQTRRQLAGRYRWWRPAGVGFRHRPDIAVAFVERAIELTRPTGVIALLVPAKLASAEYGTAARHDLASTSTLLRVADLTGHPTAEFDATVYPLALVARKERPAAGHRVATGLGGTAGTVPQASLRGGGPWVLSERAPLRTAERLRSEHPSVAERLTCQLGVKTGANRVFLDPPHTVEAELVRWAVRGRDLRPFRARPLRRLLWPYQPDGRPVERLPPGAAAHLGQHLPALRARADFVGGPPWTLFRTAAAAARHRLVWTDLARRLTACALTGRRDEEMVPLNTCYVAVTRTASEADCLAAWLNSTWLRAIARLGAVPASGGFHRFTAAAVGRLPLPDAVTSDATLLELSRAARRGEPVQENIDEVVAAHLRLTPAERARLSGLVADGPADRR
ncbi:MAG: Eco57I restriction-modification methylase domain-containing protein [Gemmatimonadales bacterium]